MTRTTLALLFLAITRTAFSQEVFPVRGEGEAPDRSYHVLHYRIEVSFDDVNKSVRGKVTTTLVPFLPELKFVEFDAEKMQIEHAALASGKELRFSLEPKKLVIPLDRIYSPRDTISVSVEYSCTPKRGLYFTQPDSGYPDKPKQIWSQGEDMDNHFWFPCYDFPNDKATSEVIATVPAGYTLLSNGELVGVTEHKKEGTRTFHWRENKPHSSYLITVAAGNYAILRDREGSLPLQYYVYPGDTEDARECFHQTPDMIKFYGEKIGYPYAWEKYAQVLIADFIEGGMENTSATSLLDFIAVYDARERLDQRPTSLIAHELAHQWWGDVVTCKDWRHLWLNESFASYFDRLYTEHALGKDEFRQDLYGDQQAGVFSDTAIGRKPIVSVGTYGLNIYPRGAAVLNMLRFVLGDELFWRGLHRYITKHQFQPVETNDLKVAIEEATGKNLFWFFDEWVYKAGHPVFSVSYKWNESSKSVLLHVRQTQKTDSLTGVFRTPVDVDVTTASGKIRYGVAILNADTTFVLAANAEPLLVAFDPDGWILKELKFDKPAKEWMYQAEFDSSCVDRMLAVRALAAMPTNEESVQLFSRISLNDVFWNVRKEAVLALGKVKTTVDSVKRRISQTLIAVCSDRKSSVRSAALTLLGKFHGQDVVDALTKALADSSYSVVASAISGLASADSAHALATVTSFLNKPSYRNTIANSALSALVRLDSVRGISEALEDVKYGKPSPTRFSALNILHRHAHGRADVIAEYRSLINDKDQGIRSRAVQALGEFGDESSLPALEKIASNEDDQAAGTAKESIRQIKGRQSGGSNGGLK